MDRGPKRTPIQIERDRKEIAELYLRGVTQAEIAARINADPERDYTLTQQMISYDLKRLQEKWLQSALVDFDQARARELAKIDNLEREYWTAWQDSRKDAETITEKERGEIYGKPTEFERTIQRKGQAGDPRFLQGVGWCIERRCKILGVDAPDKHDITSGGVTLGKIFEEALRRAYGDGDDGDSDDGTGHDTCACA